MAAQIGSLFVSLTADVQPFAQSMTRAQSATSTATGAIRRDSGAAEKAVDSFWGAAGGGGKFSPYGLIAVSRAFQNAADRAGLLRGTLLATTGVFTGFIGALSTNIVLRYADTYTNLSNQLRVVSDGAADARSKLEAIQATANRSRSSIEATSLLYSRIQKATPDKSAEDVLRYVETIQKALQLGGATAQESRSAAIQFSQAIASNRLSGDEIRAVLETPLGLELAKGLGVTIGKLREMGTEGKLTAETVLGALGKISNSIDQQFARSVLTVDQALTQLDNQLTVFFGQVNQSYGVTRLLAQGIVGIGNNLDTILPLVAATGAAIASAFIGRRIANTGGGIIAAVKEDAIAARERVVALRGQLGDLENQLVNANLKRSATAQGALTNSNQFADTSIVKAAQRADAEVARTRQKTLDAFADLQQAQQKMGQISAQVSPKAIKYADDLAAAEDRVAQAVRRQAAIRAELPAAKNFETLNLAQATITGNRDGAREATRNRIALERELIATEKSILKDREVIVQRSTQIDALQSASEQKAANARLEQARKINQLREVYRDARLTFGVAQLDQADAQRNLALSGDQNARRALAEQTGQVQQLQAAIRPLTTDLAAAERAATALGRAKAFVGSQASALVGLFGGPWGVAITGAILLMGALGAKAAKTSQEIASAQRLIEDRLAKLSQASSTTPDNSAARDSLLGSRVKKTQKELKLVEEEYARIFKKITDAQVIGKAGTSQSDRIIVNSQNAVLSLVKELADGKITTEEFNNRLDQLKDKNPVIAGLARVARDNATDLLGAAAAARSYKKELDLLSDGRLTNAQREGTKLNALEDPTRHSNYKASDNPNYVSPLRSFSEMRNDQDTIRLREEAYDVERKYQDLKKRYPAVLDEELQANARLFVGLEKAKKNYDEAAQAAASFAMEAARSQQEGAYKALTGDNDILAQYQSEAMAIEAKAQAREFETAALEKYTQAVKSGTNLTYEEFRQHEQKISVLKQVADAYDELRKAAADAHLEEQRALGDSAKAFGDFYSSLRNNINQTLLQARGKDTEARAQQIYLDGREKGVDISIETARALANEEQRADALKKAYEKAKREAENFAERLARLKESTQGAFLGDIDRAVLEHGRAMKASAADLEAYVKAARSGDFSGVSKPLMDLKGIETLKAAGQEYRNIIQQYGTWAQIAPMAAEQQKILDAAVANGSITAGQAKIAYADWLSQFRNYGWINDTANAIGSFVDSALLDFDKMGDAWDTLVKSMKSILIKELISNPVRDLMKGLMADLQSIGTSITSEIFGTGITAAVKHSGTDSARYRTVSAGSFSGAPKFHTGLASNEFRAILEKGEHVLTARMAGRTAGTIQGLAAAAAAAGAGGGGLELHIHEAPGVKADAKTSVGAAGKPRLDVFMRKIEDGIVGSIADGNGRVGQAIAERFGLDTTRNMT